MTKPPGREQAFMEFMALQADIFPKYRERILVCLRKASSVPEPAEKNIPTKLEAVRKTHHPDVTGDFLARFKNPNELKFLTHDFDPTRETRFEEVIETARRILEKTKGLPNSLFALFKRFIDGPEWTDFKGGKHRQYLSSEELKLWIEKYPTIHPSFNKDLREMFEQFRNTTRIQLAGLPKLLDLAVRQAGEKRNLSGLTINPHDLERADFHTNAYVLNRYILQPVLWDIAQRDANAIVDISYTHDAWHHYRPGILRITHRGSVSLPFDEMRHKLETEGGALGTLLSSCQGYCDWAVEADFDGECKRWHILDIQGKPETEDLPKEEIQGFTHIFTFYRSMR